MLGSSRMRSRPRRLKLRRTMQGDGRLCVYAHDYARIRAKVDDCQASKNYAIQLGFSQILPSICGIHDMIIIITHAYTPSSKLPHHAPNPTTAPPAISPPSQFTLYCMQPTLQPPQPTYNLPSPQSPHKATDPTIPNATLPLAAPSPNLTAPVTYPQAAFSPHLSHATYSARPYF